MKLSFKHLFSGVIIGAVLLISAFVSLPDGKLHLVFCDVGQGDAIYMRTPDGSDILFDGGPNDKVLSCLSKHMPFYDRTIELVLLSHPQADHLNGLISVLQRYNVSYFVSSGIGNTTMGYRELENLLKEKNVPEKKALAGEKIGLGGIVLETFWPTKEEENILGASTAESAINTLSLVLELSYGSFSALLTGDAPREILDKIYNDYNLYNNYNEQSELIEDTLPIYLRYKTLDVLKVPHHGSKTGMNLAFLQEIRPKLAVISVGLNNSYGHPTKEILGMLGGLGIKTMRTDLDGEVEIVSDGTTWEVK